MELKTTKPVTAKTVLQIFHPLTKGRLMKLCETGTIKPHMEANGQGTTRLFDVKNLVEIAICEQLHAMGMHNCILKAAVEGFNNLNTTDKIYLALLANPGKEDTGDKCNATVAMWSENDLAQYFAGKNVNGITKSTRPGLIILDVEEIAFMVSGSFDRTGNLYAGIEE